MKQCSKNTPLQKRNKERAQNITRRAFEKDGRFSASTALVNGVGSQTLGKQVEEERTRTRIKIVFGTVLVAVVFMAGALAQSFFLIFNETPFSPTNYSWEEPWEVKEMLDFVDAQLTLTGCAYEGQSHDVELVLTNVATVSDYYLLAFDYSAKWYVSETQQENIIAGAYAGDPLGIGESVTYTGVWVPTVIGVGVIKMNVIDILWGQPQAITWAQDQAILGPKNSWVEFLGYAITGATVSLIEPGNVVFTVKNKDSINPLPYDVKVEVVELAITVAEVLGESLPANQQKAYSFDFDALPSGGALTMLVTITTK